MSLAHQDQVGPELARLRRVVFAERKSPRERRMFDYLVTNQAPLAHEIARDCAIGNISDTASRLRPILERHGWTIVALAPNPPVRNRFGQISRENEWRLVRLGAPL